MTNLSAVIHVTRSWLLHPFTTNPFTLRPSHHQRRPTSPAIYRPILPGHTTYHVPSRKMAGTVEVKEVQNTTEGEALKVDFSSSVRSHFSPRLFRLFSTIRVDG